MRSRFSLPCVVALFATGCSVGSNDPFMPVDTGSASAGPSASSAPTSGSGNPSGTADPGSGAESGPGSSDTGGGGSGTEGASTTTPTATTVDDSTGGSEVGSDSTGASADACAGEPLDPQLATPPVCAPTCTGIGFGNDCPLGEYCRLKDSQTAVCETCEGCGNLHAPCAQTIDCDIIFTCFMGQCTAQCDLDTPQTCGNPAACTDVGHPTHGVCDPNL